MNLKTTPKERKLIRKFHNNSLGIGRGKREVFHLPRNMSPNDMTHLNLKILDDLETMLAKCEEWRISFDGFDPNEQKDKP